MKVGLTVFQHMKQLGDDKAAYLGDVSREAKEVGEDRIQFVLGGSDFTIPSHQNVVFLSSGEAEKARDITAYQNMSNKMRLFSRLAAEVDTELRKRPTYRVPGNGYFVEAITEVYESDESEWWVYIDEDDARRAAEQKVQDDLLESPHIFNEDFLEAHSEITRMGKNFISESSDELAYDMKHEGRDELLERAPNYGVENAEKMDDEELALAISRNRTEDIMDEIERYGVVEYFEGHFGWDVKELQDKGFVVIDEHEAAEDAIVTDGVGHFLDIYDGRPIRFDWITKDNEIKTGEAYGRN